jgi:tetratricopeptide (TPR) repeat protein
MAAVLIGLPLAAAATACTFGWIQDGRLPRLLPAVGVAVLLVDLLTTGGIGFPSVASTLWLLLALGLKGERPRAVRAAAVWAALLVMIGLAVTCFQTAYEPVLSCETQLRMAEREPIQAVEHLEAAAAADPLSAEPWRQLAAIEFDTWLQEPSADGFRRFEKANAQVLALAPNAAPAWLATGDCYFQAYSKMGPSGERADDDVLKKALNAYRRAVQLYPNNEPYRAKLAKAIQAAGDRPASRRGTP